MGEKKEKKKEGKNERVGRESFWMLKRKDRRGNWKNVMSWEIKRKGLETFGRGSENMEGLEKEERKRKRRNKQKLLIKGVVHTEYWVLVISYLA